MTNPETDRRERYAAALLGPDAAGTLDAAADEMLDAVIAVADAEQAAMPAAVSVPPPAPRADALRWAAEFAEKLMDERYGPDCAYGIGGLDVARELRRLADEAQGAAEYSRALTTPPSAEAAAHIRERLADKAQRELDDTDLSEADIDRMMAEGTPVQIVTAPPAPRADDQTAAPADWIDGHPQLEAIAAAVWERCGRDDADMPQLVLDDPRNIAVAAYAAVLAVLPEPAELAALAVNAGRALRDEKRHYEIACEENARLRDTVERVRRLHDALDAETDLTSPDHEITRGAAARKIAAALDGWTDPAELRRLAAEAQPTTKPEPCAHCGKPVRRITGTLAEWWVHTTGGNTVCFPEQAASSPRATPKPAAGAPTTTKPETDEPASTCTCGVAGDAFVPLGHYRDCPDAAGVRQDGAQP